VGGIKEKLIGALRAGVKTVLLPAQNRKDVKDLPQEVKDGLEIIHVRYVSSRLVSDGGIPSFFPLSLRAVSCTSVLPCLLSTPPPFFCSFHPCFTNPSRVHYSIGGLSFADIMATQSHLGSYSPGLARRRMARRGQDSVGAQSPLTRATSSLGVTSIWRAFAYQESVEHFGSLVIASGVPFPLSFGKRSKARRIGNMEWGVHVGLVVVHLHTRHGTAAK
jgi:hypothetical protein